MLQIEKTNASATGTNEQPAFAWRQVEEWEAALHQQIEDAAQHGRTTIQAVLAMLLQETEAERASFVQRVVSDRLQDEDPASLPDHHPVHWVQSQLEFRAQGVLEHSSPAAAEQSFQKIRDRIRPEIARSMAMLQTEVSQIVDRHVQNIRQSLAISIQPELKGQHIVLSEYINSYVPLPHIDVRAVERFSFFYSGKRLVAKDLVIEVQKTVSPWYLGGLSSQKQICYQIASEQVITMLEESLQRSSRVIQEQVNDYLHKDLRNRIERLFASVE
jgi:hypothetical protein